MNNINAVPAGDDKVKVSFYMNTEEFRSIRDAINASKAPDKVFMKEARKLSETYHVLCGIIGRPIEDFATDIANESIDLYIRSRDYGIKAIRNVFDQSARDAFFSENAKRDLFVIWETDFKEIVDSISININEEKMVSEMVYAALRTSYFSSESSAEKKENMRSAMLKKCAVNKASEVIDKACNSIEKYGRESGFQIDSVEKCVKSIVDLETRLMMEEMLEDYLSKYRLEAEMNDEDNSNK